MRDFKIPNQIHNRNPNQSEKNATDCKKSQWNCGEILERGEEISEKIRLKESVEKRDEPREDVGQESLNKLPPDKTENLTNEPPVEAVKEMLESTDSAALIDAALEICI